MSENGQQFIFMDYPLDQLLNRECKIPVAERKGSTDPNGSGSLRGLLLPDDKEDSPGTGNIILRGKPGTAKSTLALSIANQFSDEPNKFSSLFISLEEPPAYVIKRARDYGWDKNTKILKHLHDLSEFSLPEYCGDVLHHILTQPADCPLCGHDNKPCGCKKTLEHNPIINPKIILPHLSPRSLIVNDTNESGLFLERYKQLEYLLGAANSMREHYKGDPQIRLLCIDSLNVFGDKQLTREELYRIFDLCRRFEMIGLFVVEENESSTMREETSSNGDVLEYLADVVISLTTGEDKGHFMRYLEIVKSRYQPQVYGRHPFKLTNERKPKGKGKKSAIKIYPSLHYIVSATEKKVKKSETNPTNKQKHRKRIETHFGIQDLHELLPELKDPICMIITGPSGTLKSTIARNSLFTGLRHGNNALLISLRDQIRLNEDRIKNKGLRVSDMLYKDFYDGPNWKKDWKSNPLEPNTKFEKIVHTHNNYEKNIVEIAFKSGYLLPEEFIDILRNVIDDNIEAKTPIKRVVFDDVSSLGVSYPLLHSNETAGNMFLPTFIHLMKYYNLDLVMTGTTGAFSESDIMVQRAVALAETVLKCEFKDIFGDRYVLISGKGMVVGTGMKTQSQETVPGILDVRGESFKLDIHKLKGLVGFDTGHIHRPGLTLNIFQEGELQKAYNQEVSELLKRAFSQPQTRQSQLVSIQDFDSKRTEAVHDSIDVIDEAPLDKTVIYSVDEFYRFKKSFVNLKYERKKSDPNHGGAGKRAENGIVYEIENSINYNPINESQEAGEANPDSQDIRTIPYYANVLLLAYRKDLKWGFADENGLWSDKGCSNSCRSCSFENKPTESHLKWKCLYHRGAMLKGAPDGLVYIDFDRYAAETLACLLMDALISGYVMDQPEYFEGLRINPKQNESVLEESVLPNNKQYTIKQLHEIAYMIETLKKSPNYKNIFDEDPQKQSDNQNMVPNATIYVCWYSQLRTLLSQAPVLVDKIGICSLPGWGFTGDWHLGIMKGSVSTGLGIKVLNSLCHEREEYKRFLRGVGMPTLKAFYDQTKEDKSKLFAWPGTETGISELKSIHDYAFSRSELDNYQEINSIISNICHQLFAYQGDLLEKPGFVKDIMKQFRYQIDIFTRKDIR